MTPHPGSGEIGAVISMTWPQYLRRECSYGGRAVSLLPPGREILATLLMRRGHIVSHNDLIDVLWPDPDNSPEWERDTLTMHVSNLRRRIPGVITTHCRRGYFIDLPAVEPLAEAA